VKLHAVNNNKQNLQTQDIFVTKQTLSS